MKATRKIELKKGIVLTLWVELHELDTEGDPWEGIPATHEKWYETKFEIEFGGKKLAGNSINDSEIQMKMYRERGFVSPNTEILLTVHDGKNIARVELTHETAEKFRTARNEATEEVTTTEAREFFERKERAKKESEIAEAQDVVARAEKYITEVGQLRTNKERREWERNYNNVMNEGGEGFVPHYPSQEEYDEAKATLAALR